MPEINDCALAPPEPLDMFTLAEMLKSQKAEKKACKERLAALEVIIEATELQLYDLMLAQDLQRFSKGGSTFYLICKPTASVPAEHNDEVNAWFERHGMGDIIKHAINYQTLNAQVTSMIGEGTVDDLPADLRPLLKLYDKLSVGVRKG